MKKRISKALALVLTVLMLLSVLPATAVMAAASLVPEPVLVPKTAGRVVTAGGAVVFQEEYPNANYRNTKVPGVEFNPANNTITLRNYTGGAISARTDELKGTMDLTVVVTGKCSASISADYIAWVPAIRNKDYEVITPGYSEDRSGNLTIAGSGELYSNYINTSRVLTITNAKVTATSIYAEKGVVVDTGTKGSLVVDSGSAEGAVKVGVGAGIAINGRGVRMEGTGVLRQPTKKNLKASPNCKTVKAFAMRTNAELVRTGEVDEFNRYQYTLTNRSATNFPYISIQPVASKLKMNATAKIMFPGQRYVSSAVSFPYYTANTKLTFKSSNPKVATVNKDTGEVVAVSKGSAKITARNGEKKKGVTKITVGAALPVGTNPAVYVELNKDELNLSVKQSYTLKTTLFPAKPSSTKLIWESSNPDVATVNSKGKVIAKSSGYCTITVETAEGGRSDSCAVSVY